MDDEVLFVDMDEGNLAHGKEFQWVGVIDDHVQGGGSEVRRGCLDVVGLVGRKGGGFG